MLRLKHRSIQLSMKRGLVLQLYDEFNFFSKTPTSSPRHPCDTFARGIFVTSIGISRMFRKDHSLLRHHAEIKHVARGNPIDPTDTFVKFKLPPGSLWKGYSLKAPITLLGILAKSFLRPTTFSLQLSLNPMQQMSQITSSERTLSS